MMHVFAQMERMEQEVETGFFDSALASFEQDERVAVVGGSRTGKTKLSVEAAYRQKRAHRHTDSLVGVLEWGQDSEAVSKWLSEPGRWIVEGVTTARAIRKWLAANPNAPVPFTIVRLTEPREELSEGQAVMNKGLDTIWESIAPELAARGAKILYPTEKKDFDTIADTP